KANQPRTTNQTVVYDPGTDTWSVGNPLIQQRSFPSGTNVGSSYLVAVGGYNGSSTTNAVEVAQAAGGGGCTTPTPTPTGTPPTATPTACITNYTITSSTGATVVPATTFVAGSNCDDCSSTVALPFPFSLYGQSFNSVNAISNGNLQFNSADTTFTNTCLPYTAANYSIMPHWDDLLLTGTNEGIYTSLTGTAPNRVFNIEWVGEYFSGGGNVDFEVRLFEGSTTFEVIYGTVDQSGSSATVGV